MILGGNGVYYYSNNLLNYDNLETIYGAGNDAGIMFNGTDFIIDADRQLAGSKAIIKSKNGTWIENNLTVTALKGAGNAYACINANGQLYRSATTCV